MIILDTSALIRYFVKDDLRKASEVKKLITTKKNIYIPDVVFPELEYVLTGSVYQRTREDVTKTFTFICACDAMTVSSYIYRAVIYYEQSQLDMADCIIASVAHNENIASFDKKPIQVSEASPVLKP